MSYPFLIFCLQILKFFLSYLIICWWGFCLHLEFFIFILHFFSDFISTFVSWNTFTVSFHCIFMVCIEAFVHILLKIFENIGNYCFEYIILYFTEISFLMFYCSRITGLWRWYHFLAIHVCTFALGSRRLKIWCLRCSLVFQYIILSLLDGCSIVWVLLTTLDSRQVWWLWGLW